VFARTPSPGLAVYRASLLRPRPPPLRVVHVPPERSQVDVRRALDVSVRRKCTEEVAVGALRVVRAAKQLALLLGRRGDELVRIDASGQKPATLVDIASLLGGALGELGSPAR
jgi:hypothetical protein